MDRAFAVPRLYAIADTASLAPMGVEQAVGVLIAAGVRWIQLRTTGTEDGRWLEQARSSVTRAAPFEARIWMNDRPDLARLSGCHGVHLGQSDLPPAAARDWLGADVLIGCSTHDRLQIRRAEDDPAIDVIAVGPVFETASKDEVAPVVGLDLVSWARRTTTKPLVAIGGIDAANARRTLEAGADCVAVIGALCRGDVERNADRLLRAVDPD